MIENTVKSLYPQGYVCFLDIAATEFRL